MERDGNSRPLVSFPVFGYNQEKYISQALDAALSQEYEPIEFIFSDDCSQDRTYAIMEEYAIKYRDSYSIRLNRNSENLGLTGHFNKVNRMARGEIFVYAAGDDVSLPGRTRVVVDEFQTGNAPSLIISNAIKFTDDSDIGLLNPNSKEKLRLPRGHPLLTKVPGFNGCTIAVKREMVDRFPDLSTALIAEDTIQVRRACLLNGITYIPQPLLRYRVHEHNISQKKFESSKDFLMNLEMWLNDIQRQYDQLRQDISCVSEINLVDEEGLIDAYERSNIRRQKMIKSGLFESINAAIGEVIFWREPETFREMIRLLLIRWWPSLVGLKD